MAGEKILLVEYDPRTLKETKDILLKAGFNVHEAADGLSALSLFEEIKPDLVLMSPMLPKVHGFDVCQRIKSNPAGKNTPVIIISDVYKGKRYRIDAIHHYKADDFVEKPISEGDLVKLLLNAIAKYKKVKPVESKPAEEPQKKIEQIKPDTTIKISPEQMVDNVEVITGSDSKREEELVEVPLEEKAVPVVEQTVIEMPPPPSSSPPQMKSSVQSAPAKDNTQKSKKLSLDSDIERKLADTLSGLELGRPAKPKPKADDIQPPKAKAPTPVEEVPIEKMISQATEKEKAPAIKQQVRPPVAETEKKMVPSVEESANIMTSEELFEDVIQSVEQEASARIEPELSVPELEMKVQEISKKVQEPVVKEKEKKVKSGQLASKVASVESEIEKKLSDTLAGLSKEFNIKTTSPKPAKPETQKSTAKAKDTDVKTVRKEEAPKAEVLVQEPEEAIMSPPPAEAGIAHAKESPKESAVPAEELLEAMEEEVSTEGLVYGSYILLEKIATGGMAELFKAKKKGVEGFEKVLAIKRILPHLSDNEEFVKMFVDEAKLAAQLTHPNIVQIYELGKVDNSLFIAMELVDGKDIRSVLKKTKQLNMPVPIPISIYIASKLCSALDYAHRLKNQQGDLVNIVHRDVSSQNILLSFEGEVKLVDFGIAKAAVKAHQTQIGALKGKLLYMSPEQASAKPVDRRSDIFALGIILWELIANRSLFYEKGDSEVSIIDKVRDAIIPDIKKYRKNIPDELSSILLKALMKDASNRFQNASEMQTELDNLLHHLHIQITQSTISKYLAALFSDNIMALSEMEKQLELPIAETVVVAPEKKIEEPVKRSMPVEATPSEHIPEPLQKTPAEVSAKHFPKLDMYGAEATGEKKKNYLTYIISAIIGLIIIGVIYSLLRPKGTPEKPQAQAPITAPANPTPPPANPMPTPPVTKPSVTPKDTKASKKETKPETNAKEVKPPEKTETPPTKEEKKTPEVVQPSVEKKEPTTTPPETTKPPETKKEEPKVTQPEVTPPKPTPPPETTPPVEKKEEPVKIAQSPSQPAEEKINEGDLVAMDSEVVAPVPTKKVVPSYPLAAKKQGVEGLVILQALIDEKGNVQLVKSLRGDSMLSGAAQDAVKQWKFVPATKKGVRVKIWYTITIPFKIK